MTSDFAETRGAEEQQLDAISDQVANPHFPDTSQARIIFDELALGCFEKLKQEGKLDSLPSALERAARTIVYVRDILNPKIEEADPGSETHRQLSALQKSGDLTGTVWRFPDARTAYMDGVSSPDCWPIDSEDLSKAVVHYLRNPAYRSPKLERIMASALAYQQALDTGETLQDMGSGRGFLGFLADASVTDRSERKRSNRFAVADFLSGTLWFLLAVLIGLAAASRYEWWVGFLAGFGAYVLFFFYRLSSRLPVLIAGYKASTLLAEMQALSRQFKEEPLSPAYVRERLYATSASGAVWPTALVSLIEHAHSRNSVDWR